MHPAIAPLGVMIDADAQLFSSSWVLHHIHDALASDDDHGHHGRVQTCCQCRLLMQAALCSFDRKVRTRGLDRDLALWYLLHEVRPDGGTGHPAEYDSRVLDGLRGLRVLDGLIARPHRAATGKTYGRALAIAKVAGLLTEPIRVHVELLGHVIAQAQTQEVHLDTAPVPRFGELATALGWNVEGPDAARNGTGVDDGARRAELAWRATEAALLADPRATRMLDKHVYSQTQSLSRVALVAVRDDGVGARDPIEPIENICAADPTGDYVEALLELVCRSLDLTSLPDRLDHIVGRILRSELGIRFDELPNFRSVFAETVTALRDLAARDEAFDRAAHPVVAETVAALRDLAARRDVIDRAARKGAADRTLDSAQLAAHLEEALRTGTYRLPYGPAHAATRAEWIARTVDTEIRPRVRALLGG